MKSKIVFLGCGAVSKCCIHYLPKFFKLKYNQVTVIDKDLNAFNFPTIQKAIERGATRLHYNISRNNIAHLLDKIVKVEPYDIVVDLTTNTQTYKILEECQMRKVLYINTSIEDDKKLMVNKKCLINSSIFLQHINIQSINNKINKNDNITSVIEFGMNPGLISVFVKQGIMDIAKLAIKHRNTKSDREFRKDLKLYYKNKDFKNLSRVLKIRTVHCSEIDTQLPLNEPKQKFINTWSCVGLITEGIEPAEIQLGTHEKSIPFKKTNVNQLVPQLITTKKPGKDIKMKSIVPLKIKNDGSVEFTYIEGRCIHHGEGLSLNRFLGSFEYSPTLHYVYQLNPITDTLLDEINQKELIKITDDSKKWKVLNMYEDNLKGYDNVGALFLFDENPLTGVQEPYSFWTGSILDTDYTTKVLKDKYFGPTTIQVMAGILSGVRWMLKNKHSGIVFGEDLDDNYIIKLCKKYLGKYYSGPVDKSVCLKNITLNKLIVQGQDDTTTNVNEL